MQPCVAFLEAFGFSDIHVKSELHSVSSNTAFCFSAFTASKDLKY